MNKFKIKSSKVVILAIGLLLAFSLSLFFPFNTASAWAAESEVQECEAKIYSQISIDEDFDDSCVLVVMDKVY